MLEITLVQDSDGMMHYVIIQYTRSPHGPAAEHQKVRGFCAALPPFSLVLSFPK